MNPRESLIVAGHALENALGKITENRRLCADAGFISTPLGILQLEAMNDITVGLRGIKTLEVIARSQLAAADREHTVFSLSGTYGESDTVAQLLCFAAVNEYTRLYRDDEKLQSFADLAVTLISKPDGQDVKCGCFAAIVQTIYNHLYCTADEPRLYDFFIGLHASLVKTLVKNTS